VSWFAGYTETSARLLVFSKSWSRRRSAYSLACVVGPEGRLHEKPDVQATSEDIALSLGASVLLEPSRDRRAVSLVGLGGIPSAGRVPRELDRARTPDSKVRV
jgi:hypothetical protein